MSVSLFNITERYINILELLENPDVPVEVVEDSLQHMEGELNEKIENIIAFIRSLEGDVAVIDNEITRLQNRKKGINNKVNALKQYIEDCLRLINLKKVKTSLNTVSIQLNPPSVEILDEDKIPEEFKIKETTVKIDKKAILKLLKEDVKIDGVEKRQTESLRIR